MQIRVLREADIKKLMPMKDAIAADKEALSLYSQGACTIPLRTNIDILEHMGQSLYMYGYVPEALASGVKIVSVYPENASRGIPSVPATMVMLNALTGEVAGILDGTYLTRLRTGAVSGAATDELARKDAKVFALFGTGGQAETQLEAVLSVRPIEEVRVFDIAKECADAFCERVQKRFDVKIEAAASSDAAVYGADIITTVTTAKTAVFDAKNISEGAHINGVGSYTPAMAELPKEALLRADAIFVDTYEGALAEAGSLVQPIEEGVLSASSITGELGELIDRKVGGRTSQDDITVFVTTGTAALDLVVAAKIMQEAEAAQIGQLIEL